MNLFEHYKAINKKEKKLNINNLSAPTRKVYALIDSEGKIPKTAKLFNEPGEVLIVMGRQMNPQEKEIFSGLGAELLVLPLAKGYIDLEKLFKLLGERGITSILVEGGSILLGSIFDQGLVDKVVVFIAHIIVGGEKARTAVAGRGVDKVIDSFKLKRVDVEKFGQDIMVSGYVAAGGKG